MKLKHYVLWICSVGLLTACGTTTQIVVKKELVAPDDAALLDCKMEEPPNKEIYLNSSHEEKEAMLFNKLMQGTSDAIDCNKRWAGLRKWKADQLKLFSQSVKTKL